MATYALVIIKSIETCCSPLGIMVTLLNKKESTEHFSSEGA
jgi:hypothetical protein